MSVREILEISVVFVLALAWYLSYTAARLDRLHTRAEGAVSALDANLLRRAEASLELANTGVLDPASSMLLAAAASDALERTTEHAGADLLDGQHFGRREDVESQLTDALAATMTADVRAGLAADEGPAGDAWERVVAAGRRAQYARNFLNQAVRDVRRVRGKVVVRVFHLAGYAALPDFVEFDDALPGDPAA